MSSGTDNASEFDLIRTLFAPLAVGFEGAFELGDDAAVFSCSPSSELVVTKDAMVAGVHFLEDDFADNIARKLIRTNLSDMAAMGATPRHYLLAIALNERCNEQWLKTFAKALHDDQSTFGVHLIGGDTVSTNGPLTLSLTMMGEVPRGKALRRNGASAGDLLCVSGTIGDAALGLALATGNIPTVSADDTEFLTSRYFLPEPRVELGEKLVEMATACLDISDGLLADINHICEQSHVAAEVLSDAIPLSKSAQALVKRDEKLWQLIFGGGDDYELAFTIPPSSRDQLEWLSTETGVPLSVIGTVIAGEGVKVFSKDGSEVAVKSMGWQHR
ncbi:thiamine-phosphate kinase [Sneathiella glossodoripedis]|uniref:thiamine-phosphate kinase n=1 Tax=Sneathiella glossodoripedis TaxID=418853 RepID=UPI0004706AE8|nr:thiamine-phosphate kinase [Sneathiella glossodoripedis]